MKIYHEFELIFPNLLFDHMKGINIIHRIKYLIIGTYLDYVKRNLKKKLFFEQHILPSSHKRNQELKQVLLNSPKLLLKDQKFLHIQTKVPVPFEEFLVKQPKDWNTAIHQRIQQQNTHQFLDEVLLQLNHSSHRSLVARDTLEHLPSGKSIPLSPLFFRTNKDALVDGLNALDEEWS